jgi:predicted nuclease of predicted toxin-antitoxin system
MPESHRLYLNQMLRVEAAQALSDEGHDALRAAEVGQDRADDDQILQIAVAEKRILVTLDEHFGDWVVLPLSEHPGVIRLKINPTTSENAINLLLPFLRLYPPNQFRVKSSVRSLEVVSKPQIRFKGKAQADPPSPSGYGGTSRESAAYVGM